MRITLPTTERSKCLSKVLVLILLGTSVLSANEGSINWQGPFEPCNRSSELLKYDYMDLGVWLNTSNIALEAEFRRAMNFWTSVLDMTWHEENTPDCSIQVVEGSRAIFATDKAIAARSQVTNRAKFHGWIAFNPGYQLNRTEMYLAAIHEIGHMLGLQHNPNSKSVMYFLNLNGQEALDEKDLAFLATRHRLRSSSPPRMVVIPENERSFLSTPSTTRTKTSESSSGVSSDGMTR